MKSSRDNFSSLGCFLLADSTLSCVIALCTNGGKVPLLLVLFPLVNVNGVNFSEFVMGACLTDCIEAAVVVDRVMSVDSSGFLVS